MSNKESLTVGREFVVEPLGNAARWKADSGRGVVTKVGRKYFYVRYKCRNLRFDIQTHKYDNSVDFNSDYKLYDSEEDFQNKKRLEWETWSALHFI